MIYAQISMLDEPTNYCDASVRFSGSKKEIKDSGFMLEENEYPVVTGHIYPLLSMLAEHGFIPISETFFYKP